MLLRRVRSVASISVSLAASGDLMPTDQQTLSDKWPLATVGFPGRVSEVSVISVRDKVRTWFESLRPANSDRSRTDRRVSAFAASLLLHLTIVIWGACWTWESRSSAPEVMLASHWSEADGVEFSSPLEMDLQEPIDRREAGGGNESWINPLAPDVQIATPLAGSTTPANQSANSGAPDEASNDSAGAGLGKGKGNGSGRGAGFFASAPQAKSFVYVLDCSLSMNHPHDSEAKTRFKRMKMELIQSVTSLKPDQEFFIVFFNHEAIPMPANGLVPAVGENPRRYLTWMSEVVATGDTDPTQALQIALKLQPDVIYLLTDGCFSPAANDIIRHVRQQKTTIHTLAFDPQLTTKQREGIELMRQGKSSKALLKLGEGTYRRTREVFVAEEVMRQLATHNRGEYRIIQ